MDHGYSRPKQPWEESDGAIYLLSGLSSIRPMSAAKLLPLLAEIVMPSVLTRTPCCCSVPELFVALFMLHHPLTMVSQFV